VSERPAEVSLHVLTIFQWCADGSCTGA